nr:AsmA family protein [Thermoflexibacter sp.]
MKKFILISLIIINVVLLAAIILPVIYEDDIKAKINEEINKNVNAKVYFGDFGLGIFRDFPNLTASLDDFGVVNLAPFEGDTLLSAKSFGVGIDFWSLFDKEFKINGISLNQPKIQVKVLKNGDANYNIAKETPETEVDTAKSAFAAKIDHWEIKDGLIIYDDAVYQTFVKMQGFNHEGSGDFESDLFDLDLKAKVGSFTASYEKTNYLNKKQIEIGMTLEANMNDMKFTFKDNQSRINDFKFAFGGWFQMLQDGFDMDINFNAKETEFKTLLSLMPSIYTENFKDIKTEGKVAFEGMVSGVFNDKRFPKYNIRLQAFDAMFQYPSLPMPVTNINVDMEIDNKYGILEKNVVDIRRFSMDLGANPINGKLRIKGLTKYNLAADVKAEINLAEMTQVFPIKGMDLKGLFDLRLIANGDYDEKLKTIPKIDAQMSLTNGYVKSESYPLPIENMNIQALAKNETGKMQDTYVNLQKSSILLEGKPFEAKGTFKNFDDLEYDLTAKGEIDLEKITKIYPLEGMTLKGNIKGDLATKGKLSDAQAQRYEKLPTSGQMQVQNFVYTSPSVAQPVKIDEGVMTFTPQKIILEKYKGYLGSSDVNMTGEITNYIAFILKKDGILKGNLNLTSQKLDANEWMSDKSKPDTAQSPPLQVIEIPKNVDFVFNAKVGEMQYSNYKMTNNKGMITVKDGVMKLNNFNFSMLGGDFVTKGTYDPRNLAHPLFDFGFSIKDLGIPNAFTNFTSVKTFAPVANGATGFFSTDLNLKGELKSDLMPNLATLTGAGLINLAEIGLKKSGLLEKISQFTKLKDFSGQNLKNLLLKAQFINGKMFVEPFDVKLSDYKANIAGSIGFDGSLDYFLKLDVPKNQIANELSQKLDAITGGVQSQAQTVQVNLRISGTYTAPQFKLEKGGTAETIKQEIAQKIAQEKEVAKEIAK